MYKIIVDYITNQPAQCIKRLSDNAFIPLDPANTDYQEYLKWLAEGNEPFPDDHIISDAKNTQTDINTATHQELTELSGVGASLANAIIDGRPWNSIHDLSSISGISQNMIDNWDITTS